MQSLRIQGSSVTLPYVCACCLGRAEHLSEVVHRDSQLLGGGVTRRVKLILGVPYCTPCLRHVLWVRNSVGNYVGIATAVAITALAGLGVGAALAAAILGTSPGTFRGLVAVAVMLAPPTVLGFLVLRALKRWSKRHRFPGLGHAAAGDAVEIDAQATLLRPKVGTEMISAPSLTFLTLRVHCDGYAERILAANAHSSIVEGS